MKKIILLSFIAIAINIKAQIIFDFAQDSASTIGGGTGSAQSELMIVNFEVSGYQYVNINRY
ncbi:MAG TPA: hypothetical protein VF411_11220, partial [Bacteroidia bacterium]